LKRYVSLLLSKTTAKHWLYTGLALVLLGGMTKAGMQMVSAAVPDSTLPIPPLLTPAIQNGVKVFALNMGKSQGQLIPGLTSNTMGFDGSYLGPTIRVSNGDAVHMAVTNNLGEEATVHWHGMHVPAADDGGAVDALAPVGTIQDLVVSKDGRWVGVIAEAKRAVLFKLQ